LAHPIGMIKKTPNAAALYSLYVAV